MDGDPRELLDPENPGPLTDHAAKDCQNGGWFEAPNQAETGAIRPAGPCGYQQAHRPQLIGLPRREVVLAALDLSLYKTVNGFAFHHDRFEDVLRFFAQDAQYFFVGLLAVLFLAGGSWASRNARHGVVAAGFSAALALGIAQVITHIWERPRPYVAHPDLSHLFISASPDPSFPSDHATAAFAIAVSIFLRNRRIGALALVMAAVLAVARVAVGAHYPGDVLGGAVLGTLCALFFWLPAVRRPLHALADWAAGIYDSVLEKVFGLPAPSASR
jgi:undecaprenyl-diphosphatase